MAAPGDAPPDWEETALSSSVDDVDQVVVEQVTARRLAVLCLGRPELLGGELLLARCDAPGLRGP